MKRLIIVFILVIGIGLSQIPMKDYFGRILGSPLLVTLYDNQYKRYVYLTIPEFNKFLSNYVGGPTGAIVVNNNTNPPEIDIDTSIVPQKGHSETIKGKWAFEQ